MDETILSVLKQLEKRDKLPIIPDSTLLPLPAINKVELYLSFSCNDYCPHCLTDSGPDEFLALDIPDAYTIIENIRKYSIINQLPLIFKEGYYSAPYYETINNLDNRKNPPVVLNHEEKELYTDCLMNKDRTSFWENKSGFIELNFGRPFIRISGGEFYQWPLRIRSSKPSKEDRLYAQQQLLNKIRIELPEYDIWILTNGRFAGSQEDADTAIKHWSENKPSAEGAAKTRISLSLDIFHRPPEGSTIEDMLRHIWTACNKTGMPAPYLYGIPNHRISMLGRAFRRFKPGVIKKENLKNLSGSSVNPLSDLYIDPMDLVKSNGCNELKGFIFNYGDKGLIANNLVVAPDGHAAFCCACLGDFGDFVHEPANCLKNMLSNPLAIMLRNSQTAIDLLTTAVECDPGIAVFGSGKYAAATGSTCYQLMSGLRKHNGYY